MYRVKDQNGYTKYSGRSRGIVRDNRDPLNKGRIIVEHPLVGDSTWIEYLRTPGHFTVPSIGDVVYVEADAGQAEYPIAWGNLTTGTDASPNLREEFRRDIPTNRGIFTPGGHIMEFDDGIAPLSGAVTDTNFTTEKRGVRITTTAGNKIHIAEDTDNSQQFLLIEDINGNLIKLDYKENKITINSTKTTEFNTDENRTDTTGNNFTEDVGNDKSKTIGNNETNNVGSNKDETIGSNSTQTVGGNATQNVSGNKTDDVGGNLDITVGGSCNLTVTGACTVTAASIALNGTSSGITTANSHLNVIDLITGVPVTPSPTVTSDV
jgi:hypothetical protein